MMRGQCPENTKCSCSGLRMCYVLKLGMDILHKNDNLTKNERTCCKSKGLCLTSSDMCYLHLFLILALVF